MEPLFLPGSTRMTPVMTSAQLTCETCRTSWFRLRLPKWYAYVMSSLMRSVLRHGHHRRCLVLRDSTLWWDLVSGNCCKGTVQRGNEPWKHGLLDEEAATYFQVGRGSSRNHLCCKASLAVRRRSGSYMNKRRRRSNP